MITLITGGIKSGKSAYALKFCHPGLKGAFIATADSKDSSLTVKIETHRKEREGLSLTTIEEPVKLASVIEGHESFFEIILIDCLTLWMSNLMYFIPEKKERDIEVNLFLNCISKLKVPCFIVTNEVGLGIIPENKLARQYQEELGNLNRKVAQISGNVFFMVSGIPMTVKSS